MHILVLGGTGAMGVSLVNILSSKRYDVTITSRKQRTSQDDHIHYIMGDAHDLSFIKKLLETKYDAIIDFMVYDPESFKRRVEILLSCTDQYFYFSSSRVYADSGDKFITEKSPRLLEVTDDQIFLATDEYALAKAREEDI